MPIGARDPLLRAVVATFAPPDANLSLVAEGVTAALDGLLPHRRRQLIQFLQLLDVLAFAQDASRFDRLAVPARERLLRALADHPLPALRAGFNAFKRLVLFIAYAATDDIDDNPLWSRLGYPGPRSDVPQGCPTLPLTEPRAGTLSADVVVIGSGAGGGVAAALFSAAGYRTIVLEAGGPADGVARQQREASAVASLYLESGLAATTDLGVSVLAGSCLGGGTTVNWSTSLRLREKVAVQWAEACAVPELDAELEGAFAAVEKRLGLSALRTHNRNNAVIARGCEGLGWHVTSIPRNASGCSAGCGYCGFGCAYGNKRGTVATYLRDAVENGATIFANVCAERVRIEGGAVSGVDASLAPSAAGGKLHVKAPLVVLAAGALRTPGILARSGLRSPHLGRHLKLHPVAALAAQFDESIEPWSGPIQSALCDRFADAAEDGYGAVVECAPAHPGLAALAIPWREQTQHAREMSRLRNSAVLIALVRDRGEGQVGLDRRADIHYRLAPSDANHLRLGLVAAATIALAAGARRISTFHANPVILERRDAATIGVTDFAETVRKRGFASNRSILFSAHQMGTARMHADPRKGVVDGYGRVHGTEGLIVADSSTFPLASGVNPMLTVMALAERAVRHRIDH